MSVNRVLIFFCTMFFCGYEVKMFAIRGQSKSLSIKNGQGIIKKSCEDKLVRKISFVPDDTVITAFLSSLASEKSSKTNPRNFENICANLSRIYKARHECKTMFSGNYRELLSNTIYLFQARIYRYPNTTDKEEYQAYLFKLIKNYNNKGGQEEYYYEVKYLYNELVRFVSATPLN